MPLLSLLAACVDPARVYAAEGLSEAPGVGLTASADTALAEPLPLDLPGHRAADNPLLGGDHPDPQVLRTLEPDGSPRYWLVATAGSGNDIRVWTSIDLVDWEVATEGLFGVQGRPGDSLALNGGHYCHVWAPELVELGTDSYLLSFTATRYDTPQSPCPPYAEDGGVYLAWAPRPTGPFAADHPWEPVPAGAHPTCALRDTLPRSLDRASPDCQGGSCQDVMRLDSTVFTDPDTDRRWLAYAWYTNSRARVEWETRNLGEHVSLVELDPEDPFAVRCDAAVPRVHAANPHDTLTLDRLAASCPGCDTMLSNTRGLHDEEMQRDGHRWGVAEAPTLLRRNGLVYLFVSGSSWDSAWYHVYWIAAPSVEELSWQNSERLVGRLLVPGEGQSFGHGSVVLGPDGEELYLVHHRLDHAACLGGDCSREVWLTPIRFEDRGDGRGDVWVTTRWPATDGEVGVAIR